jgi:hypothetical protein
MAARHLIRHLLPAWFGLACLPAAAQTELPPPVLGHGTPEFYGLGSAVPDVKYELAGIFLIITGVGIKSWNWGNSDFRFNSEHWFGMDTGSAGIDKLGHAHLGYAINQFLSWRLAPHAGSPTAAARNAAIMTAGLLTYIEVFDGFSGDHGFSYEDLVMDLGGIGFSYLRRTVPGLDDKLDFRWQYWPSKYASGFQPVTDYNGQKYILALKLAGFEALRDTPWRFLELHAGYYSRGFTEEAEDSGDQRRATLYLGFSVNFSELLVRPFRERYPRTTDIADATLEYVQIPYTSVEALRWKRTAPPQNAAPEP